MNHLLKISLGALVAVTGFASCDKADDLNTFSEGTAPIVTSSNATSAPLTADSNNAVTNFSWSSPAYPSYSDNNVVYRIEVDSAGKNFSNPQTIESFTGGLTHGVTAKTLNTYALEKMDYPATVPVDLEMRMITSKPNNNERFISGAMKLHYTPYIPDMPVVAAIPVTTMPVNNELYMVGNMTPGGWNNPVPVPTQKLTKTGDIYSVTLPVNANSEFLLLPVNGSWNAKYALQGPPADSAPKQGYFGYNANGNFNDNFKGPVKAGSYFFRFNVATGSYYVVRVA